MQGVVTRDIGKYGVKSKHQYTILMRVINIYFQDFFLKNLNRMKILVSCIILEKRGLGSKHLKFLNYLRRS